MVKKRKRKKQNQRQTQSPRAALRSLWGRWARARRQHRPRRRCTAGPNTAGAGPAARAEGRWRAVKGRTVLPGLYLSWSPRSCRRGAPLAGRPRRRPGTAPCPGRRRRPPPALPAARWRRGAERAGSGSSSARPQDGGRGRRARCWRRCWQAGGWPGGFLWDSAYRAPSAAALRDWSREVLREEAGGSFQSQPVLPTALIPHDARRDRRPERCLGSRECSAVLKVLPAEARRPLLVIRACPESRPAWQPAPAREQITSGSRASWPRSHPACQTASMSLPSTEELEK